MEVEEITNQLNIITTKVDVNNLIYSNVNIWPILLRDFYFHQLRVNGNKKYSRSKKVYDLFKSIILSLFCSEKFRLRDVSEAENFFLSYSTFKRGKIEGKWFDSYADSTIVSEKINNYVVAEVLQRGVHRDKSFFKHFVIPHTLFLKGKIHAYFKKNVEVFSSEIKITLRLFQDFGYYKTEKEFIKELNEIFYYASYYSKFLNNSRIENVYTTAYTMNFSTGLILAANNAGLRTVEIQHGTIFRGNPLFTDCIVDSNLLPKYVNVWSAVEFNLMSGNRFRLLPLNKGDAFNRIFEENLLTLDYENRLWSSAKLTKENTVLVCFGREDLPDFVFAIIMRYSWVTFIFRPHPGLNNGNFLKRQVNFQRAIYLPNVIYGRISFLPLPFILRKVSFLTAWASTTLIDALKLGVMPILIDSSNHDYFIDYINEKKIYVANCVNDLENLLSREN